MSTYYYKCESCSEIQSEHTIFTIRIVGIEKYNFKLCESCIDDLDLIEIDFDDFQDEQKRKALIATLDLTAEEIEKIDDEEPVYHCKDMVKFLESIKDDIIFQIDNMTQKLYDLNKLKPGEN